MPDVPTGTITFLFTDMEGSTALWEHHPSDTMLTALARHDALLRSAITAHGGYVFKTVGDAVYASFADSADAVSAALAAQRALAAEEWGEVGPLRVRMALHTGVAYYHDNDYHGRTLNRISRILSTGHGGQILLSAATVELVLDSLPGGTNVIDLGEHTLRDLPRPVHIFQLTAPDQPAEFPALLSPAEHERQTQQQMMWVGDFQHALNARNWNQAENVLQRYPDLAEGRSRLGLSMSNAVQEYFSNQLRPGTSPFVGGPVTPMYTTQFAQLLPAPPTREAIHWLEEALQYEEDPDGDVIASLTLMYGYDEAYEKMIDSLQKALIVNPSRMTYFQRPENLMMLLRACHDLASVEEVMQHVQLKLPQKEDVQQAIREAIESTPHDYIRVSPVKWYALEMKMGDISRIPAEVLIAIPGTEGLTYAQIIKKDQWTITIPPESSMVIDPKTLLPIDEILKQLTEKGFVLITRM
jgi:class 3 adenylate cyclase